MPSLSATKASNGAYCPTYIPVIIVFGGTSGIGKATTKALAEHTKGRVHIIIVGRNKVAADSIIASLPKPITEEDASYEFLSCDLMLMRNVHTVTKGISARFSKINYLILASGNPGFGGREETEEGIDKKLALRYYWKFAVITDLLPLLQKARDSGEDAGALAILGAGNGFKVDFDDLGLKKRYSGSKAMMQGITYNDLMMAIFAKHEPDIAFTHMSPGFVATEGINFSNWLLKFIVFIFWPLIWFLAMTPDVSAEYVIFALLNGEKGFYQRNPKGDSIIVRGISQSEVDLQRFWDHSVEATRSKDSEVVQVPASLH